ncbi:hypothetical protein V6N13_021369 [Hibiscus sabdariffa]
MSSMVLSADVQRATADPPPRVVLVNLLQPHQLYMEYSCVPPGFRFHPTDEELVGYYLRKKVASQMIDLMLSGTSISIESNHGTLKRGVGLEPRSKMSGIREY